MDLTRLVDRIEIEDLVNTYARARDTTDADLYRVIFTDDAQVVLPDGAVLTAGIDAILGKVAADARRFNPSRQTDPSAYAAMRHIVTNLIVAIEGGSATAEYYVLTMAYDDENQQPGIVSFGRNHDDLVYRDGRWRIARSVLAYDWGNNALSRALQLGPHSPGASR